MKSSSCKQVLALFFLLVIFGTAADGQRRKAAAAASPAQLSKIKVIPYDRMQDTFSDEITDLESDHLNQIDNSYLVKIEVSGKAGDYSSRLVVVTVREGNKLLLTRSTMVGILNDNGKYFIPVWIYGPLCSPTTIEARLTGQSKISTLKKKINFQCGE
jgi:hypothetical protein